MTERVFVDSNVLVYAHDRGAGERHRIARDLVLDLWRDRAGVISTQVLQETYVNLRRKAANPIGLEEARELIAEYLVWQVVVNDGAAVLDALRYEQRYGLSFWDALIASAANTSGARTLLTEDLNHGQRYGAVTVQNPFRQGTSGRSDTST
jgi:predicted nucleic acid-binding protein